MPETKDPVAALDAKDIPTRAAGARDLALAGGPEHIDRLLIAATRDNSPGVRLAAAGAAADILSRYRLPPAFGEIAPARRAAWLGTVAGVDPGVNTGLFAVCGTLGTPEGFNRIVAGLRDPRQDVRAGACVGLWRHIASGALNGHNEVEARVVATLGDQRIRIESRVEIAKICADAGWYSAMEAVRLLPDQTVRQTRAAAEALITRFEAGASPIGLWVDNGADVMALDPKARGEAVVALLSATDAVFTGSRGAVERRAPEGPVRVLRAPPADKENAVAVVQIGQRSWWPADGEDVCRFGDRLIAANRFDLLALCEGVLGETSAALRVRGVALLAKGDLPGGLLALEAAVSGKKVPTDAWWHYADALARSGRADEARPHLEKYLSKAGKRGAFVEEAKRRIVTEG